MVIDYDQVRAHVYKSFGLIKEQGWEGQVLIL